MQYCEARPSPRLTEYVKCFWQLRDDAPASHSPDPVLPDGSMEIVFNLADPFRRYHPDGLSEIQPKAILVGQMTVHTMIAPTGRISLFGIRFHANGAFPLLRMPLNEFANRIPNVDAAFGRA